MFNIRVENNQVILTNKQYNTSEVMIDFGEAIHNNTSLIASSKLMESYINMMQNYELIKKYTYGETTIIDIIGIMTLVFKELMSNKSTGVRALEVGSWFGCSSYFYANSLKTFSENNVLFCMDTWQGSPDTASHNIANYENALEHFRSVMKYGGVSDIVKPIVCDSTIGLDILQDNYFDIIFVDANHTYDYVYQDIIKSIRKIKVGGLLMGHDCECYADELPPHLLHGDNKHLDGVEGFHTGVIKALADIFGRSYSRFGPSLVWYKRITQEDKELIEKLMDSSEQQDLDSIQSVMQTVRDALQYIYDNLQENKSETISSISNDTLNAVNQMEKVLNSGEEKYEKRELKLKLNLLTGALIDFKIAYEDGDLSHALQIFDHQVVSCFHESLITLDTTIDRSRK